MSNTLLESSETETNKTAENRQPPSVAWYRTRIAPKELKKLHERSDFLGFLQTFSYLGLLLATGTTAFWAAGRLHVGIVLLIIFFHGMCYAFTINAVHELIHGTVFKTKFLNPLFARVFAFLGWHQLEIFETTHPLHHRHTLQVPDDIEVMLPQYSTLKDFLLNGFLNYRGIYPTLRNTLRLARGKFKGQLEESLFSKADPKTQKRPIHWARVLLAGHGLIIAISVYFHLWLIPVLITFAPFYGSWLQQLCNSSQHIGLQDKVADFRLNSRTFIPNPFVQFLYWHMNYHIEHHMYAAVPCYRLSRLHRLIKHDLPPTPHGLIPMWKEIIAIQKIQKANPAYQYIAPLPSCPAT